MKKGDLIPVIHTPARKLGICYGIPIPSELTDLNSTSIDDKVKIIVKNAVVGQKSIVKIVKKRKGRYYGQIEEILEDDSTENTCPAAGRCGGCLYQNISRENEKKIKEDFLEDLFAGYPFKGLIDIPNRHRYRNKMEYTFGNSYKEGPLTIGLHERGKFYNIVEQEGCVLAPKDFLTILSALTNYFRDKDTSFYRKFSHEGLLRHLVLRRSFTTGEILINLVTTTQEKIDWDELTSYLLNLELEGDIAGIIHTLNDNPADAVIPEKIELKYGKDYLTETILDNEFLITPFSFFQVNKEGTEILYSLVIDKLKKIAEKNKDLRIADLYSGTGTIGIIAAPYVSSVSSIELNEEASEIAKENALKNNVDNITFIAGDVLTEAEKIKEDLDLIILDPPREGIHPKALPKIIDLNPDHFIYISCNPAALRRDLEIFENNDYEVKEIQSVNMFPMTPHLESVAVIKKKQ